MKVIFDSDVLIDHFRSRDLYPLLAQALSRSQVYMSSIVAMELRAGCRTPADTRILEQFLRPFEAAGRVVPPDHGICLRAGAVLALLGRRCGLPPEKRRAMSHDALIAASALSIGAALVTNNRADFALISRCLSLPWFGTLPEFLDASQA